MRTARTPADAAAWPTLTRDMVPRGQVRAWLEDFAQNYTPGQ